MSLKYKGQDLMYWPNDAKCVDYDNTKSGLSAENIQNAVDELAGTVSTRLGNSDISGIGDGTVTGAIASINNELSPIVEVFDDVVVSTTLPSDASSHPKTLYLITG